MLILLGFLVALLAVSLWAARKLPAAGEASESREADNFLTGVGWRWFVLLLMPVNWLMLDAVVLMSEASVDAGGSTGVTIGQLAGGMAVLTTHLALVAILLKWSRR